MTLTDDILKKLKETDSFDEAVDILEEESGESFDADQLKILKEKYEEFMSCSDGKLYGSECADHLEGCAATFGLAIFFF